MYRRRVVLGLFSFAATAACSRTWETAYEKNPPATQSSQWRAADIVVIVPETLTISNADTLSPNADIVWHGEGLGDTRAQVASILEEATEIAASKLKGNGRRVIIEVTLKQFHSITNRARRSLSGIGVHNIQFGLRVIDAQTNRILAEDENVSAALPAYSGTAAIEAVVQGQTQRVRVVRHISDVISAWLGTGPDVRGSFVRIGR